MENGRKTHFKGLKPKLEEKLYNFKNLILFCIHYVVCIKIGQEHINVGALFITQK